MIDVNIWYVTVRKEVKYYTKYILCLVASI